MEVDPDAKPEPDIMDDGEDEAKMFGYYFDLKRGWIDCDLKIIAFKTVDALLEKVWLKLEPDCEHLESSQWNYQQIQELSNKTKF